MVRWSRVDEPWRATVLCGVSFWIQVQEWYRFTYFQYMGLNAMAAAATIGVSVAFF